MGIGADHENNSHVHIILDNIKISIILTIIFSFEIISKYNIEKTYRIIFLNEIGIKIENKKISKLLSILVPGFVKENLIEGNYKFSEDQGAVAILFCDICNFDKIVADEKKNIVKFIDDLYRVFDTFCNEYHIQKIEVIIFFSPFIFFIRQ